MDVQAFWNVIGHYNEQTGIVQIVLFVFILAAMLLSYRKGIGAPAKFALGIANLFIGIIFFGRYGTEPIQKYFALPLFVLCGVLFLYESLHNKDDILQKPNKPQGMLLLLYLLYPFASMLLGNQFPQMVTYIMPCPVVSLSIAVYAGCQQKNKLLLAMLTIWGLTGVKSIIFHAYEDIILLVYGFYGVALLRKEIKHSKGS